MTEVRPRGGERLAVEMGAENNNLAPPPRGQLSGNSQQSERAAERAESGELQSLGN
jgi:hypothetical protein